MKKETLAVLAAAALCVFGCKSSTVADRQPGPMPGYRDRTERRFDRPLNDVFAAAKRAFVSYGNITAENSFFSTTNQVHTLAGLVNQSRVWMRIEGVTPTATLVTVQIRAKMGGTDLAMAEELENRIAFELTP